MTSYQPFLDDPRHIEELDGQRFVVLRPSVAVSPVYGQIQDACRERLRGRLVSYPARAHVTLCGFATGSSLQAVQELVRAWVPGVPQLRIEVVRVTSFPAPFQTVIVEVRQTPALVSALATLRAAAEQERLTISTVIPVEKWTFHLSVAYCSRLDPSAWQELTQFLGALRVPAVHDDVGVAEVVAFDQGREYSGGTYAFGPDPAALHDDCGRAV